LAACGVVVGIAMIRSGEVLRLTSVNTAGCASSASLAVTKYSPVTVFAVSDGAVTVPVELVSLTTVETRPGKVAVAPPSRPLSVDV
jgi:uncharacterized protein YcfL